MNQQEETARRARIDEARAALRCALSEWVKAGSAHQRLASGCTAGARKSDAVNAMPRRLAAARSVT